MKPQNLTSEIAIAGAGLAGLTLALSLAQENFACILLDRDAEKDLTRAKDDLRTTALSAGAKAILTKLNIWRELEPHTTPILDIRVSDGKAPVFLHFDSDEVGDEPMGHIILNSILREKLLAAVKRAGVAVLGRAEVRAMENKDTGIEVTLSDEKKITAQLLTGADGKFSTVRTLSGIECKTIDYKQSAIVAVLSHQLPHHHIAHERFLPKGPIALLPMENNHSALVWTQDHQAAQDCLEIEPEIFASLVAEQFGGSLGDMKLAGKRALYKLDLTHAHRYSAPRTVLIADAAHAIHPIAGQGLNLGLRDVESLTEILIKSRALGLRAGDAFVTAEYNKRRAGDVVAMVAATDGFNRLFSNDNSLIRNARQWGLGMVQQLPPVRRYFMRQAMGLPKNKKKPA
ncbi:MAG: UbiH/UbiF/VisC/COQ6 family ubiquinone biosynthesis hydroxylase [Dongiaceae bacterium]